MHNISANLYALGLPLDFNIDNILIKSVFISCVKAPFSFGDNAKGVILPNNEIRALGSPFANVLISTSANVPAADLGNPAK